MNTSSQYHSRIRCVASLQSNMRNGMEEVVGSIPTRSTIKSTAYRQRCFWFGSIWYQIGSKFFRALFFAPFSAHFSPQFLADRIDRCLHTFRNFLHVNIGRRRSPGMPQQTLHIFHRPLFLCQGSNRSANDLKGELWQFQFVRKSLQYPLAIVARTAKASVLVREDEGLWGAIGTRLLTASLGRRHTLLTRS